MTNQDPTAQNKSTKTIILYYFSTLALFVGTAFVSGAIVHTGNISELYKYLVIGIIGIGLFIAGSFIQESIINSKNLQEEGIAKFFLFSLMLSVGIGMISGGTQHFSDFPVYSSYLIPIGLIVSYLAFLLKNNFTFTKNLVVIGLIFTVMAGAGFIGLNTYAKNLTDQAIKVTSALCKKSSFNPFTIDALASASHDETTCPMVMDTNQVTTHDMDSIVTSDQSFLENMIPHHQEAINTSYIIQATTQDLELKQFAGNVITNQNKEVKEMKEWYKKWFNKEYIDNTLYKPMMTKMNGLSGTQLNKSYIQDMALHHTGAIQMAKKMQTIKDPKPELLTLASNIIKDQNSEIQILNGWLKSKFTQDPSNSSSASKSENRLPVSKVESDGHAAH